MKIQLYEFKVIEKLKTYLIDKGYPESSLQEHHLIRDGIYLQIDLAILDNEKIVEIYEIKSPVEIKNISKEESKYKKIEEKFASKIPAFFVALDKDELIFSQISDAVNAFITFYNSLKKYVKEEEEFTYFFRGHSSIKYVLKPGIYRKNDHCKGVENEDVLFKEAVRRNPVDFPDRTSTFEKLVKMQHYGLPTRLLDITTNPLVALYFAVSESISEDGEIYIFKIKNSDLKYYDSDAVSVVSNLARRPIDFYNPQIADWKKYNKNVIISYLLHEIRYEKPHFQSVINKHDIEKVFCVLPKLDNPRIMKQSGAFFLYGIKGKKSEHAILNQVPRRIIINKGGKNNLLKELKVLGIDKSTLFPEIDHVMEIIKEK